MTNPSDGLQAALTRLEAGEPLEAVTATLPAEDAELLKLASAMRATQSPRAAGAVRAQRQTLLRSAQAQRPALPSARPAWVLPVAISGAFIAVAFAAFLSLAALGALWWWNSRGGDPVAQNPTRVATSTPIAAAPSNPREATLNAARGLVEVQAGDGTWATASGGAVVEARQRVRTGALSSVTLAFYDGSRARLGPNSEIAVDTLDAQRSGARVIQLTQVSGDSDHDVAKSAEANSVYEVNTPSGAGRAKGTQFHVSVTALAIRFDVSEGAVDVSNVNVTVVVIAGHSTVVVIGQPPAPPLPRFSGEGEVQEINEAAWRIAGQTVLVNAGTLILGQPQVGDRVLFEGRLQPDGSKIADRLTLLSRRLTNTFRFIGTVEAIGAEAWTISGRTVRVDAATVIEPGIAVSDTVEASGEVAADGALVATRLDRLEPELEPFSLTGVVQSIAATAWSVSGVTVTVEVSTTIEAGIVVSDVVEVQGVVLADGTRLARSIAKLADGVVGEFEFTGIVISLDPWNVSGVPLATDDDTEIDDGLRIGNRVRVEGRVLADGAYLATAIERVDNGARHAIQFTARVQSIEPWVVGGVTVTVDSKTKIDDDIELGDWVTVKGNLLPDGAVIAKKITRVEAGPGCTSLTAIVVAINGNTLTLSDGQTLTLDDSIEVTGQLSLASVVIVQMCVGEDGGVMVIAIIVIFQLDELPPTPTPAPTATPLPTLTALPPPPSTGGSYDIRGNGETLTLTCTGHTVTIRGNNNRVTLLGACASVTVRGNNNWVSVQSATSITNTGNNNTVQGP